MEKQLNSETKRKILIELLNKGDPKRRQELFKFYSQYFNQNYSTGFLIEFLNSDLELETKKITRKDIKYIREYLAKKPKIETSKRVEREEPPDTFLFQNEDEIQKDLNFNEINFTEKITKRKELL